MLTNMRRRREGGQFPYRAQVLDRSFAILDLLAASSEDLSLADMGEKLKLHKSTFYRLLRTLERHRFAEKDFDTGKYRLGSKLLQLGSRAVARFDLATVGRPYLEKLKEQSGETAALGVLSDGEVVSIAVAEGRHVLRMHVTVGGKVPVHCSALGKAILAFLPEKEVDMIVRKHGIKANTRNTITRRPELKAELAHIRTGGFAIDDQEIEDGLKCVGAPVRDSSGRVIAAVSIAGAALRLNRKRISVLAPLVARTASDFSGSLGYRPGALVSPGRQS
jgi:IclR family transcriptional regulator, KDG regulon repressor